jgi:lipopolysaccharide export system permease protein
MKILTRYILREFCVPLFYCLTGFVSIYLLFELFGSFSRLMAAKPGIPAAAAYLAGYFAPYFQWMAPACLMLATLYTMWRFCRHSEIVAMRASGIGFFTIVKPVLATAAFMACAVAWVNESYVPRHSSWAKQFKDAHFNAAETGEAKGILFVNERAGRRWQADMPRSRRARALENVRVTVRDPGSLLDLSAHRERRISSARAVFKGGQWYFFAPRVVWYEKGVETQDESVPQGAGLWCFPEFNERPEELMRENCEWAYMSTRDRIGYLETHANLEERTRRRYRYDVWAQAVAPFACLVITLFAIPMGIATGRQSVSKGIIGALAMFFAFYGLSILCMVLAARGWLAPFPAAILPDLVFLALGMRLFWKNR